MQSLQELALLANEQTKGEIMKKVLLLPLVAIGLALVPIKQVDAQVSVGIGPVGVGFGYPAYGYSYYGYPGYGYYPRSYYSYTAVLHITERTITMVGPITAAIDITSITSVIITVIEAIG